MRNKQRPGVATSSAPIPGYPGGQPVYYSQQPMPGYYPPIAARGRTAWPGQNNFPPYSAQPQGLPGRGRAGQSSGAGGRGNNLGGSRGGRGQGRKGANQQPPSVPPDQLVLQGELTLDTLNQVPFEQQKLLLGERLYPLIHKLQPTRAGKITGMLLDSGWSVEDLLALVNDEAKLSNKVVEAVGVLDHHAAQSEQPQADQGPDPNGQ